MNINNGTLTEKRSTFGIDLLESWRWLFPVPKEIQSSDKFKDVKALRAMMTTSVSTVRIITFSIPDWLACAAWRSIRVSASSWSDENKSDAFSTDALVTIEDPIVLTINFWDSTFEIWFARNSKSSVLFSSNRKNYFQFTGILVVGRTLLRIPLLKKKHRLKTFALKSHQLIS